MATIRKNKMKRMIVRRKNTNHEKQKIESEKVYNYA